VTDVLENHRVRAVIDPSRGARLTSLVIDGHEVLAHASDPGIDPAIADGCFPMVPWAGRIRDGRLMLGGESHQLPQTDGDHALHGLGHVSAWERVAEGAYELAIGDPWPAEGVATLTYQLIDDGIRIELSWDDDTEAPCSIGLHPWFRRRLDSGVELVASLRPEVMVERGHDGLPTGTLVAPTAGPWDDCFRLGSSPVLTWPGALELSLSSSADWWVVYDEPADTICVEPQTAPPDAFNHPHLQPEGPWPHGVWLEITARPA
jgi:galactose mutarotase-like enzyme